MFEQNLQQKSEFCEKRFSRIFRKHPIFADFPQTPDFRCIPQDGDSSTEARVTRLGKFLPIG
jgi:hypothetical protein